MPLSKDLPFIAIDWGMLNFRAALIAPDGEILDELAEPRGIATFKTGEFAPFMIATCARMTKAGGQSFLLSGMIGGREGMVQVPYVGCPATPTDIARGVKWAVKDRVALTPGVRFESQDVMRGQETHAFGAAAVLGLQDAYMLLLGPHCKWVNFQNGCIMGFDTFMTGELYSLLSQHSMLAHSLQPGAQTLDQSAFLHGFDYACESHSLLNAAFSLRVKTVLGEIEPTQAGSYLSGILIGEEFKAMQVQPGVEVVMVGHQLQRERYELAFKHLGVHVRSLGSQAAWAGMYLIYQALCRL